MFVAGGTRASRIVVRAGERGAAAVGGGAQSRGAGRAARPVGVSGGARRLSGGAAPLARAVHVRAHARGRVPAHLDRVVRCRLLLLLSRYVIASNKNIIVLHPLNKTLCDIFKKSSNNITKAPIIGCN